MYTIITLGTLDITTMQLLLIDNRINDIETIINSVNATTCCIVFNYYHDTADTIISKIRFLNVRNRVIRDHFYYEVPTVPVITDLSNCLLCDDDGVLKQYLSASDIAARALEHAVSYSNNSSPTPWNVSSNECVPVSVFFQRNDIISTTINDEVTNTIVKPLPVLITDLDDIYEVFKTMPYESLPYTYQVDNSDNTVPNSVPYTEFSTIGIIQHAYVMNGSATYNFTNTMEPAILSDVKLNDSSLDTWKPFIDFVKAVLIRHNGHTLDLMACALYTDANWKYVIDELQTRLEINIRASLDNTGTALMGGNWILETDGANLKDVYFTDEIDEWNYLLATVTDTRFYTLQFNEIMYLSYPGSSTAVNVVTGDFTFETWYYETSRQTNCTIFDKGNYNYTWQIRSSNYNGLSLYNINTDWLHAHNAVVPEAQWSHLAITRSGSTFKFYINGTLMQTITNSTTLYNNGTNFAIGLQSPDSCGCNRMKTGCRLYDARIWNVCRTDNQIKLNRNRIVPSNSTGLVANYLLTFNSSTSATAATSISDRTSNAINLNFVSYTNTWSNIVPVPNIGFYIANNYLQDVITEPSNLVARYNFDITAVTIDSSPNNNTLTNVSDVSFNTTEYKHGTASATFNGSNYFQITNDGRFSPDNFTIAFWIRPKATSGLHQAIASCRGTNAGGWFIYIAPNNNLEFFTGPGPSIGAWNGGSVYSNFGSLFQDIWVHIAITVNKSTSSCILYLNGNSVLTTTRTYVNNTGTNMRIGAGANESTAVFIVRNGTLMDDFRFYNQVLSSSEVVAVARVATKVAVNYGDLTSTDFSGVNFSGVNFTGTTLTGSNFTNCNFTNATLVNITVDSSTNFTGANFTNVTSSGIVGTPIFVSEEYLFSGGSIVPAAPAPTIGPLAAIPTKTFGIDVSFSLTDPSSNSTGAFTYSSSNTSVATVTSRTVTIIGVGTSTITATQLSDSNYRSASVSTVLTVNAIPPTFGPFILGPKLGSYVLADASFSLTAPTSNSAGSFTYTSDNSAVAIIRTTTTVSHTTTNLLVKYDATVTSSYTLSGSNVTEWRDLTGNGYHLIPNGTGPSVGTINGINALNFGGDKGLRTSSSPPLASAITIFMVIKYSTNISRYGSFIHHGNRDTDWSIERDGFNNRLVFESGNNNNVAFDVTNDVNYILIGRIVGTTRQFWRYSNTESTIFSSGTPIQIATGNKQIYIGRSDYGGTAESCNSHIGEILYYNASLSDADVSANLLYLQSKWFNGNVTISMSPHALLVANGTANITATQDACGNYLSKSITSLLSVGGSQIASTFASSTFTVASSKTFGDVSFAITTRPTSNSDGIIIYTSNNNNVATIDPSGNFITIVGVGNVSFNATQAATVQYLSSIKTSNTLTVSAGLPTFGPFILGPKSGSYVLADASFSLTAPTSNSAGSFTYTSDNSAVAIVRSTRTNTTTNLLAKYDASDTSSYTLSGSNVTQWRDLTGNGYHLTANGTGPTLTTINSIQAFNFNSGYGLLRTSVPLNTVVTVFMVVKYSTNIGLYGSFMHHGNRDTDWSIERDAGSSNVLFQSNNSSNVALSAANNTNYIWIGRIVGNTREFWRYSDTASTGFISGTPVTISAGNKTVYVGKSDSGEGCNSIIGEILYYNASLSDADVSANLLYLQSKWFNGNMSLTNPFVSLVANGIANITATQDACGNYLSNSVTTFLTVGVTQVASTFESSTFTVASSKTFGDVSFAITTRPTSNSTGVITYSSSNTNVATIDPSGNIITLVGAGDVSFNATQAATAVYTSATKTSNTLTVARATSTLSASSFAVPSSKTFGNAPFSFDTLPTSNNTGVAIVYTSSNTNVATVDASGTTITLVGAGDVSFNASQPQTNQYNAATTTSNTLTVARGTSTLAASSFAVPSSKTFGNAPFSFDTLPTSNNSSVAIVYSSSNTNVATVDASGTTITLVGAGDVSFNAAQPQTNQYNAANKTSNTLTVARGTSTLAASSFAVPSSKTVGDAPFSFNTLPTSNNSSVAIVYSSSNTNVATVDASGTTITIVGGGDVSFNATQPQTNQYNAATKTSNTLTVSRLISTLSASSFAVQSSKTVGDAPFSFDTLPTSNNSSVAIVYSSSNTNVATVDASGTTITIVGAGDVSFNATQIQTNQYNAATKTSNTLTVSKGTTTLSFVNPPTTKNVTDAPFTLVVSSASTGTLTYSSSNVSIATVNASSGIVTLKTAGSVTITASQASSANYHAPANVTCSFIIESAGTALQGQTVSSSTSFASVDLSGASLAGTTVAGVSFSGANLRNVNFSGAVITNANFSNTNIKGATNLPAFSTVQKLQLLKNINNADISAIQVTTPVSGSDINALLSTPRSEIAAATFTVKAPVTVDASANKVVTVSASDVSGNKSIYIPINANETVKINNTVYSFDGTNLVNPATGSNVSYLSIDGKPFKIYAGSVVALNVQDFLNKITINGDGLYNVLYNILVPRTI